MAYPSAAFTLAARLGNWIMRLISPVLFALCELAIFSILYIFFLYMLPPLLDSSRSKVNIRRINCRYVTR